MKIIKSLEIILHGISDYLTLIENNGKMFAVWFDEESGDALCIFEEQADEFEKRLREMEKAGMRIGVCIMFDIPRGDVERVYEISKPPVLEPLVVLPKQTEKKRRYHVPKQMGKNRLNAKPRRR